MCVYYVYVCNKSIADQIHMKKEGRGLGGVVNPNIPNENHKHIGSSIFRGNTADLRSILISTEFCKRKIFKRSLLLAVLPLQNELSKGTR